MADGSWLLVHGPEPSSDREMADSGIGQTIRVNWPRWSSSRPLPPRPVTSYLPVLMVCSAPRVVSTVEQVAVAGRGDGAEDAVLGAELDQDHALAGSGQEIHLVGPARHAAGLGGGGNQDLVAGQPGDVHDLRRFGRPCVAAARAGARLDQPVERRTCSA
mgnify:CR=1 FL=1